MPRPALIALLTVAIALTAAVPARAADACPNAAYRAGAAASLPDCRAWEQVSPADKNGLNVLSFFGTPATSSRALFVTGGPLPQSDSGPYNSVSVATRADGWSTRGVDPPLRVNPVDAYVAVATTLDVSDDLTRALVVSTRRLTSDAVEGDTSFYLRNLDDGTFRLAFAVPGRNAFDRIVNPGGVNLVAAESPDLGHFALVTDVALTADAVSGRRTLYQWDGGALRIAAITPGDQGGSATPSGNFEANRRREQFGYSVDGRRLTLALTKPDPDNGDKLPVYQRIDGQTTVLISRSHRDRVDPTVPVSVRSDAGGVWASPDGTQVTFADSPAFDSQGLTNASPANGAGRIYRWYADGDRLVDLLAGVTAEPVVGATIQHQSTDGRFVWFFADRPLGPDASADERNFYVLDTQRSRLSLVSGFQSFVQPRMSWSRGGSTVAILSGQPLTGADADRPNPSCSSNDGVADRCDQVFAFAAASSSPRLMCASCGPAGTPSTGPARFGVDATTPVGKLPAHAALDDGRVFFDTPDSLAPADVNRVSDVYEYVPGQGVSLVTSGTGSHPAAFTDTDTGAENVFFITADQLVGSDDDVLSDLYDARVGGGSASQQSTPRPTPCSGDGCRDGVAETPPPPSAAPPAAAVAASPSFTLQTPSRATRRAAAKTGRLPVTVRVSTAGKVTVRARATLERKRRIAASGTRTAKRAGTVGITLRLSRKARRRLGRKGKLKLALTASFSRVTTTKSVSVTLERAPAREKGASR